MYLLYFIGSISLSTFDAAAPSVRAADRADNSIKVLHVFLEDPLGVEPTRCVMGSSDVPSSRVH